MDHVGTIVEVRGPVVEIECPQLPPIHRALFSRLGKETFVFEVFLHSDEQHARAITLNKTGGISRGLAVYDSGGPLSVPVSPECLGRMLNVLGAPLRWWRTASCCRKMGFIGKPASSK